MLPRAGSGLSVLLTVVLAVLFFAPWVKVKCNGPMGKMTVAKATGWQLATGGLTKVEQPQMNSGDQPQTPSQGPSPANISARPWFYLGLLIPLAGAILSLLSVGGRLALASAGKALIVVGILGVAIAILAANVDYSDEIKMPAPQPTPQASSDPGQALGNAMMQGFMKPATKMLVTEPTGAVWWSLVLYVIVAACGVVNLVLPSMLRRSPSPEPPQPAPSPPTPDASDPSDEV